jgi:coenzyme F420-reducing hydrogenase gamma subunit
MVAHGTLCLGPITHAGCGALCPSFNRGCYGCYGPKETAMPEALGAWFIKGMSRDKAATRRALLTFYAGSESLRKAAEALDG